jgi:hypothetical protein
MSNISENQHDHVEIIYFFVSKSMFFLISMNQQLNQPELLNDILNYFIIYNPFMNVLLINYLMEKVF